MKNLHQTQNSILNLANKQDINTMTLRAIGEQVGVSNPETIRHHIRQLQKIGLLSENLVPTQQIEGPLVNTPLYGEANCGQATKFANNEVEGYIQLSKSFFKGAPEKEFYLLRASGDSMNNSRINGDTTIEDGDLVLIKRTNTAESGDYVVTLINDCANIKKFKNSDGVISLISESKSPNRFPPIYLEEDDNPMIVGRVIKILKS